MSLLHFIHRRIKANRSRPGPTAKTGMDSAAGTTLKQQAIERWENEGGEIPSVPGKSSADAALQSCCEDRAGQGDVGGRADG